MIISGARDNAGDANFEDPESAQAIVVPGWEINAEMEEDKWDAIMEHPQIVFARTSPQQKLIIVGQNQVSSCVENFEDLLRRTSSCVKCYFPLRRSKCSYRLLDIGCS